MTDTHDFRLEIKAVDDAGTFSGLASTFGPPADSFGDVIAAGAFKKTLAEHKANGTNPLLLWSHDTAEPIGKWLNIKETGDGLAVTGKLTLGVQKAKELHALLLDDAINGLSIGFTTIESHAE
ncbi:MAG: HK97 family phage prohead protease, partial [Chloroflexi bacterium]|nr:HK97 family phage prohead protease [Chloroflexota bacterium]